VICPACAAPLSAARTARTMLWHCTACGGLAATLAAVRTVAAPEVIAAA
jgi:ribosomal protein L37AE/L43A